MHTNGKIHRNGRATPHELYEWMRAESWFALRNAAWETLLPQVGLEKFALITLILRETVGRGFSKCTLSQEELGAMTGTSRRTMQRLLHDLTDSGHLQQYRKWSQQGSMKSCYCAGDATWIALGRPMHHSDALRNTPS